MNSVTYDKHQINSQEPKYNMAKNIRYMIKLAWKERKRVVILCLLTSFLAVVLNLLRLLVIPVILAQVEAAVPISKLIVTILLFAGGLLIVDTMQSFFLTIIPFEHNSFRIIIASIITQNIGNDSTTLAFWLRLSDFIKNVLGFIIYLVMFSYLDYKIIVMILVTTIAGFIVNKCVSNWSYKHRNEEAEFSQKMNYISNHAGNANIAKDIRLFNMGNWLEDLYTSTLRLYQSFIAKEQKVYMLGSIADAIFSFARNGVAYIYLIGLVLHNGLSASRFLLLYTAVGGITVWVNGILTVATELHKESLEISTLREFLEYPEPFVFEEGEAIEPDNNKKYKIELKNVSFRYPDAQQDTLRNINLTIEPGEKLAVVGLNGAGKTTLVKLICGFYDPTEGEILLNGENIRKYNRRDYYKHFSAVFQEFSILPISIAQNVSQSLNETDMDKVRDCVKKAGLTEKIESLPKQYETNIGNEIFDDGIHLSGGETQRFMLARALYKDSPVLILDEPTAALDPIAESEIYEKYNEMTENRTSVYISHRLASTRFCDRIILIGENSILEEGSHDELLQKGGRYYELFQIQSQYYRDNSESELEVIDKGGVKCE